jgi:hypothetical protein
MASAGLPLRTAPGAPAVPPVPAVPAGPTAPGVADALDAPAALDAPDVNSRLEVEASYSGGNGGASEPGAQTTHRPSPSLNHETRPDDPDRRQRTPR